jgi:hypothetical protein
LAVSYFLDKFHGSSSDRVLHWHREAIAKDSVSKRRQMPFSPSAQNDVRPILIAAQLFFSSVMS